MKQIIGMIHLKALPTTPNNNASIEEIYEFALNDLKALEAGGATEAIVENFFDMPYEINPNIDILSAYITIFTRLKQEANIPLGVNIHSCYNDVEMVIATMCNAKFIRAESYVEHRYSLSGTLKPMAPLLTRTKRRLNSNVLIYADINVKESYACSPQSIEEAVNDAIKSNADAIILTGFETGKSPTVEQAQYVKGLTKNTPLLIGSGVNKNNIKDLLKYADGVIVGSSIKNNNDINANVNKDSVETLVNQNNL